MHDERDFAFLEELERKKREERSEPRRSHAAALALCSSGDATGRLWRLSERSASGEPACTVLRHTGGPKGKDVTRDVASLDWSVSWRASAAETRGSRQGARAGGGLLQRLGAPLPALSRCSQTAPASRRAATTAAAVSGASMAPCSTCSRVTRSRSSACSGRPTAAAS